MAEKKKGKQRKTEEVKPTKEEYAVAKYLRFNLSTREGKLHGMDVKCFHGNSAVDKLLQSKWSATKNKKDPLFTNRNSCVAFMLRLLEMGIFHRAEREHRKRDKEKDKAKRKKKEKDGDKEELAPVEEEVKERKGKKDRKAKKEKDGDTPVDDEGDKKELDKKVEKKHDEKKRKEKRLKLIMPEQQFFEDGDEIYVWIYDPVNAKTFLIGLLMVLGAIALCMFPLWPEEVRIGVYYLSIALAGFVGFILSLVVVRLILFCLIWTITLGRHHFWLLPNLTEDVGFFDSFRPLYKHDAVDRSGEHKEHKKKKPGDKKEEEKQTSQAVLAEELSKAKSQSDKDDFELIQTEDLDPPKDLNTDDEVDENKNNNDEGHEDDEDREEEDDEDEDDDEEDSSELSKDKRDEKKKTK